MAYPPLIRLSPEVEARLESYLWDEMNNHYAERGTWIQDINQAQKDYWAKPVSKTATFPFVGASTLIVPLTAISAESIHASVMTSLYALEDFVHIKSVNDQWDDANAPYSRYLNYVLKKVVQIEKVSDNLSLENTKFGTCVGKTGYECVKKKAVRFVGGQIQEFEVTIKDGPCADAVSIGHFLMPFQCQDAQFAPWCGEEHDRSPYEVKLLQDNGFFYEGVYEFLLTYISQSNSGINGQERALEQVQEQLENRVPVYPKYLNWQEIWLSFDIGLDQPVELVVHYHWASRKLMCVRYNPHSDLHRPYRHTNYFPVEHRWNGIGVAKQNEQFQREITMIHRQKLDSGTLSNSVMFKIHKMSGYGPKEPFFPGKFWFLDDMSHIESFSMRDDVKASAYANASETLMYSQQRTGVNELTLGMPQAGTPGTATSDLSRIQEGKKKFDYSFRKFKQLHLDLVTDIACLMQQYGPRLITQTMSGGSLVEQYLQLPDVFVRDGLIFELAITGQNSNKVLDRQNWVQLAQLTQQYWTGQIQLAQLTGNPEMVGMIALKAMTAVDVVYKQIVETYDLRNIDKITLEQMLGGLSNGSTAGTPLIGGANSNPQAGGAGRMAPVGANGQPLIPIFS